MPMSYPMLIMLSRTSRAILICYLRLKPDLVLTVYSGSEVHLVAYDYHICCILVIY